MEIKELLTKLLFPTNIIVASMKNYYFILILVLVSCKTTKPTADSTVQTGMHMDESQVEKGTEKINAPNLLIYKTRGDYSNFVPVILSTGKNRIVSYPDPSDLVKNGIIQKPIALHGGYWLDRRGINKNVAFLKITYEEYSKAKQAPLVAEMLKQILDKEPLLELYDCGSYILTDGLVLKIDSWIDSGKLGTECKILK
jgi:hypothetical protein